MSKPRFISLTSNTEDSTGSVARIAYVECVRVHRRGMLRTADSLGRCASAGIMYSPVSLDLVHILLVHCPVRLPLPLYTLTLSDYPWPLESRC